MGLIDRLGRGRPYTPRRFATQQKEVTERETSIIDPRFRFDVLTVETIRRFRLQPAITPVLSIPLVYNASRKVFEVTEAPNLVISRDQGYYYGASLPTLTETGYYNIALDSRARQFVNIFGRDVSLAWVHGAEVTAPSAGTALVSKTVSTGKSGYVYGFFISATEPNDFKINWTSGGATYSVRIVFGGKGSINYIDFVPINEGMAADSETQITITNVNAGASGQIYQARLLYAEV